MTEFNDKTIEKIAKVIKEGKISDVWKDPKKAQTWGIGGWIVAVIAVYAAIICIAYVTIIEPTNVTVIEDWIEVKNIAFANMDCQALKQTLLDLEKTIPDTSSSLDLEKQIIARCI